MRPDHQRAGTRAQPSAGGRCARGAALAGVTAGRGRALLDRPALCGTGRCARWRLRAARRAPATGRPRRAFARGLVHCRQHCLVGAPDHPGHDGGGSIAGACLHARDRRSGDAGGHRGRPARAALATGPDRAGGPALAGRRARAEWTAVGARGPGLPSPLRRYQPAHGRVRAGPVGAARLQRRRRQRPLRRAGRGAATALRHAADPAVIPVLGSQCLGRAGGVRRAAGRGDAMAQCPTGKPAGSRRDRRACRLTAAGGPLHRPAAGSRRLRRSAARRARPARRHTRTAGGPAVAGGTSAAAAAGRRRGTTRRLLPLRARPDRCAARREPVCRSRQHDGTDRRVRLGQDHVGTPDCALLRRRPGQRAGRRGRRTRHVADATGGPDQPDFPGQLPVHRHHCRQHPPRPARSERRRPHGSRAPGRRDRNHRAPAARAGDAGRRRRRAVVRRRTAAHRHCARLDQECAHPAGGRSHCRARRREPGGHRRHVGAIAWPAHPHRDRAPAIHRVHGRPDRGNGRRPDRRIGNARAVARKRRALRPFPGPAPGRQGWRIAPAAPGRER